MLNPHYQLPDKEEIREEVEKRQTVTAKLSYLRRLLVKHEQDAELPPEKRYGFDINDGVIEVGKNASLKVEVGVGVEEADREIIDDMRRWLKKEIEYWEKKLPATCITQKELEEGLEQEEIEAAIGGQGEGELVPWHGTQEEFTNWLSLSYDEWIGKYFDDERKKFTFKDVAKTLAPLFYSVDYDEPEKRTPMNSTTVAKHKSQDKKGEEANRRIIENAKEDNKK